MKYTNLCRPDTGISESRNFPVVNGSLDAGKAVLPIPTEFALKRSTFRGSEVIIPNQLDELPKVFGPL